MNHTQQIMLVLTIGLIGAANSLCINCIESKGKRVIAGILNGLGSGCFAMLALSVFA
jgi:hypothetical protein